jgi:hypothetical protein
MIARRVIPVVFALVTSGLAVAAAVCAFDGVMPGPLPGEGHLFAPGPVALGFQGLHVNPSSIGDFDGTVALAYLKGRATGGDGHRFLMVNDIRLMQGTYRAADGSQHLGAFAFI